LSRPGQW